jgi:hypothetical protein
MEFLLAIFFHVKHTEVPKNNFAIILHVVKRHSIVTFQEPHDQHNIANSYVELSS